MPFPPTFFHTFLESCAQHRDNTAFVYRVGEDEFKVTYEKFFEDVLILARAFKDNKVRKGDKVFILSDNRYSWIVTDLALQALGAVSVPRGTDTPPNEIEFIVGHSDSEFLVIETDSLYNEYQPLIKSLKFKTVFIVAGSEKHSWFDKTTSYSKLLEDRSIEPRDIEWFKGLADKITSEDLLTIIYTSGTTGTPKGVMLSHDNIMHNIRTLPPLIRLESDDVWVSILPTWHIFERTAEYIHVAKGSCLVYSSIRTFAADLESYKPTLVATVPRIWESLYSKINAALKKKDPKKAKIFNLLVRVSAAYRRNARVLRDQLPVFEKRAWHLRFADKVQALVSNIFLFLPNLLAKKKLILVQEKFGGRLKGAISGGGSLPPYLDEWIDAIGIRIINAYGMTECSPGIAGRGFNCDVFGTIGPAVGETDLRIVNDQGEPVPNGIEGEIQVRGAQVFKGYYKNDEANANAFTPEGFLRTGDLGRLTLTGELVITGRAKEIIVLASGENVDPTNIEATLSMFPFVQDAVLVGQDKKGLGALIVPDLEKLREFVKEKYNQVLGETEGALRDKQLLDRLRAEMNKLLNPKKGFKPYEKLQNIHFLDKEFTLGEELTNSFKKKRHVIEKKYKDIINRLLK
ncbi:MAG: long-chain fatty acid--CoA ligase [Desulfomicrobium sp.]|nr:long-chain fatty acid--CoA ligase [Pseudomonadota bacterium]MBV1713660.1 long-chain fatty acid--CoA ligase [Desulfomicrobium sp.]MBU4572196.1 long-chain fatty acid--CoA ligase [Pseudomonadota bacterium]MBU4594174.1 long-chain fatty acid--CoA ligase [Pseudomonadota bacterium]MBV1720875.1 long-chain fatty acid--CoA ligase [Desulfomicrobium sp.]